MKKTAPRIAIVRKQPGDHAATAEQGGKRIVDAGYQCYYLPNATVIHLNHKGGTMVSPRLRMRALLSFHVDCCVYCCKHMQRWAWSPECGSLVVCEVSGRRSRLLIGANLTRIVADRGYRGHNAPPDHKFKVYISGQRRRVTETSNRQLRAGDPRHCRNAAVTGCRGFRGCEKRHAKAEHSIHLAGTHGDATNAVLAGYDFRRLLAWLAALWRAFIMAILTAARDAPIPAQTL